MIFYRLQSWVQALFRIVSPWIPSPRQSASRVTLCFLLVLLWIGVPPAFAGLTDDRFDGNIFTLYAGDGSLVPPKVGLADSLKGSKPTFLVLYTDDSQDCKQYTRIVSQLEALYGKFTDFVPLRADAIPMKASYAPNEAGYYYHGFVPTTVLFNQAGQPVLQGEGNLTFEEVDDQFRIIFDLLPRSESVPLKRRSVNEITTELIQ